MANGDLFQGSLRKVRGMKINTALAAVAQWIECRPANQRVSSSIPSGGTGLSCRFGRLSECIGRQKIDISLHIDVSLSLSLPSPLSQDQ